MKAKRPFWVRVKGFVGRLRGQECRSCRHWDRTLPTINKRRYCRNRFKMGEHTHEMVTLPCQGRSCPYWTPNAGREARTARAEENA